MNHRKYKKWTKREDKFLRENYTVLGPEACADQLGRTISATWSRMHELKKDKCQPNPVPIKPEKKASKKTTAPIVISELTQTQLTALIKNAVSDEMNKKQTQRGLLRRIASIF